MTKHKGDRPTLNMVVRTNHLVPAGPYEEEALNGYQQGAEVTVVLNQQRSLSLLKKYWAILDDIIENAKTPWGSPEEASDALKLALGVTDVGRTVTGKWYVRTASISIAAMDEARFRPYFDKSMALLAQVTGIDPDTLRDRYRHIPESEPSGGDPPRAPATQSSPDEAVLIGSPLVGTATKPLYDRQECIAKLIAVVQDETVTVQERAEILADAAEQWVEHLGEPFVKEVWSQARQVLRGKQSAGEARKYLSSLEFQATGGLI